MDHVQTAFLGGIFALLFIISLDLDKIIKLLEAAGAN